MEKQNPNYEKIIAELFAAGGNVNDIAQQFTKALNDFELKRNEEEQAQKKFQKAREQTLQQLNSKFDKAVQNKTVTLGRLADKAAVSFGTMEQDWDVDTILDFRDFVRQWLETKAIKEFKYLRKIGVRTKSDRNTEKPDTKNLVQGIIDDQKVIGEFLKSLEFLKDLF